MTAATPPHLPRARLIAVGGGKGGVGKTFLSANLAHTLVSAGYKVVAVDTDIEGPNLHTWLGVNSPRTSLADFVSGRENKVEALLQETPYSGLGLLAATHGDLAAAQPNAARRAELLSALRELPCDFVFVDCGAGAHPATIDYFLVGDEGLLVLHPEPTSVENTYTFIRAAFYRRMQLAMRKHDVRECVREAMDQRNDRGIRSPLDLLRAVEEMDPEEGQRFSKTMQGFRPRVIVNEVASTEDIKLGFSVRSVCRKYFGIEVDYAGYVNRDQAVRTAVLKRKPLAEVHPGSDAAVYLQRIAGKLAEAASKAGPSR
ncbi:MAG: MinD/ParA family protein [bacterium]|nr:MinD/ParA family protein [bacterium]